MMDEHLARIPIMLFSIDVKLSHHKEILHILYIILFPCIQSPHNANLMFKAIRLPNCNKNCDSMRYRTNTTNVKKKDNQVDLSLSLFSLASF